MRWLWVFLAGLGLVAAHAYPLLTVGCWLACVVLVPRLGLRIPGMPTAGCAFGKELMKEAGAKVEGKATAITTRRIAIHEAGHVAARPPGTRVIKVVATRGYGFVRLNKWGRNPIDNIAFLLAGQMAEGSQAGAQYDNSVIKQWLKRIPEPERKAAYKTARSRARFAINWGSVSANAAIIRETGTL